MQNNGFIDIHSHILPKLDEGPSCLKESMKMLQIARGDGISGMVATPHVQDGVYNNSRESIEKAISELDAINSGVHLYIGAEVRISRCLAQRISNNELPLLNNNNYLLLELPPYLLPPIKELENIVKNLKTLKINPIFAHPERNVPILNDLSIMERLIGCGASFQVTAMSITNRLGRRIQKATFKMIQAGYVHAVASDAHDAEKRPPALSHAYKISTEKFGSDVAKKLFYYNPFKIVSGVDID
ncbi:MAG: CpsB/CapC family capsule biosynthesis tyrosine phosphatase [Methylococcaceae bacterium]